MSDTKVLSIQALYDDSIEIEHNNFNELVLRAYLDPGHIEKILVQIVNSSSSYRPIIDKPTDKSVKMVKIFPEEILYIPLNFDIQIPFDCELLISPNLNFVNEVGLDIQYQCLIFRDDLPYLVVKNQRGSIKYIEHGMIMATAKLIKNELFDIEVK
jgi:hypothetical protein